VEHWHYCLILNNPLKVMFLVVGILFSLGFLSQYKAKSRYIDYLIEKIGKKENE